MWYLVLYHRINKCVICDTSVLRIIAFKFESDNYDAFCTFTDSSLNEMNRLLNTCMLKTEIDQSIVEDFQTKNRF